jgi:hypothetical protein
MKAVTLFLVLAALSRDARAQMPRSFTVERLIQFAPGSDPIRKVLSADPSLRDIVEGKFLIAREDLNDDGSKEMILVSEESMWCGSGGCSLVVLEIRGGKIATILSRGVLGTLAVTSEKVGEYRALASVDDKGAIVVGDKAGTPLFGKQLVYAMDVAQSAQAQPPQAAPPPTSAARQAAPRPANVAAVCASQMCTENLEFAATITDFRAILENTNTKTLTVRISFRNKLRRPLVLGYVSRSATAIDERGNRYALSGQRAVQGIGEIVGDSADAKFQLQPDEASDARFELTWNSSGREIFGLTFQLDLAIREITPMPGNQIRLGKEYALHFDRLGSATPSLTAAAPRSPDDPGRTAGTRPAPPAPAPQPQIDGCRDRPRGACVSSGPFAAEIIGLIASSLPYTVPLDLLQARVRFRNLTSQPVILAYNAGSAVITDNFGSRYASDTPSAGDGARGIGIVKDRQADPQFVLGPGASGDAIFGVSRRRARTDRVGETMSFDMTIAHLEVLPGQQIRTVRDYTLGFTNLSPAAVNNTTSATPVAGVTVAQPDACGGKPRCYNAGPFVAEITGLSSSSLPYTVPLDVLQARVRFRNLTDRPLTLGYAADSALIIDNFGNRYSSVTPSAGDGAKGIGIVSPNQADPQFVLGPGASGDVMFSLSRRRAQNDRVGANLNLDLTIAQLEVLDSRQVRTLRDYAVGVPNLTTSGPGFLNKLLQSLPKKN